MIDIERLRGDLEGFASDEWISSLVETARANISDSAHGSLPGWREILGSLPNAGRNSFDLKSPVIAAHIDWTEESQHLARESLLALKPWRKGPFNIGGIEIDTEWRSDLKWSRLENFVSPLAGRRILDVGCGNGYYALRMRGLDAKLVVGIDPTLLFVVQFAALAHFMRPEPVHVLPLRLHELPESSDLAPGFDTTFSMGVLYHQRDPIQHLLQLNESLRSGGELILETLIIPGEESALVVPDDRYARMRNVWHLPTVTRLTEWLVESGFTDIRVVDQTVTTTEEQRSTEWMPFESLQEALAPPDSSKTVEGLPAPLRAVIVCKRREENTR